MIIIFALFSKSFQYFLDFFNRCMCVRALDDEYVYTIGSCCAWKGLSFAVLSIQKGTFYDAVYEDFGIFPISNLNHILAVQQVF